MTIIDWIDWRKMPLALMSHEWIALLLLAWMLSVLLYVILQIWFGYAWTGWWRIAALAPVIGLVLVLIFFIVVSLKIPDNPPLEGLWDFLVFPLLAVMYFSPLGLIYLVIAGIVHRVRGRPTAFRP